MIALLLKQYELIKSSREVMLNFIGDQVAADLNSPVDAFDGKTIRYLLVHTANTYLHWLSSFALKQEVDFKEDSDLATLQLIREVYGQADEAVAAFLHYFSEQIEYPVSGTLSRNRQVTTTPLALFTHVTTHEFHHKGQIMTMSRLLGHIPPDTDVIRF